MQNVIINIFLCAFIYAAIRAFRFIWGSKGRDDDADNDGGLPVSLPPDIDLPPGICLPDDDPEKTKAEQEEVFV